MENGCEINAQIQKLLGELKKGADVQETLIKIIRAVSDFSGCESVGIRWKADQDYPYYVTQGFGQDFVVREGLLCERDIAGAILRNPDGTPQLACLCGAVILGRTDPSEPWFTNFGSFWTNSTTELLANLPNTLRGLKLRGFCNTVGYESVALIPLRTASQTYGLLQLNSRKIGRFTENAIDCFEHLATSIAKAVAKKKGT